MERQWRERQARAQSGLVLRLLLLVRRHAILLQLDQAVKAHGITDSALNRLLEIVQVV